MSVFAWLDAAVEFRPPASWDLPACLAALRAVMAAHRDLAQHVPRDRWPAIQRHRPEDDALAAAQALGDPDAWHAALAAYDSAIRADLAAALRADADVEAAWP